MFSGGLRCCHSIGWHHMRLSVPAALRTVDQDALGAVLPYSYEISKYRNRSFESRGVTVRIVEDIQSTGVTGLKGRRPQESYVELTYPFSCHEVLRSQYQRFDSETIRYGLVLEDMDALAGDIAHRHICGSDRPQQQRPIVTGFVDRIEWLQQGAGGLLALTDDLRMAGHVTWVGRSSLEVLMELCSRDSATGIWRFIGSARFAMVSPQPNPQTPEPLPALLPGNDLERKLFQLGAQHTQARRAKIDAGLAYKLPNGDEMGIVLRLLGLPPHGPDTGPPPGAVPMRATELSHTALMHKQDRNQSNKIFGGHLLRVAFELAWAAASMHAGEYVEALSMDDVAFVQPVPIGCIVSFVAKVVFVEGNVMRVHVKAVRLHPGESMTTVTNDFTIAFISHGGRVRPVVPESVQECLEYLHGLRQQQEDAAVLKPAL